MSSEEKKLPKTKSRRQPLAETLIPETFVESPQKLQQYEPTELLSISREDLTKETEADKLFFEKWDELSTQSLYVAVGIFAVLPTVLNALRSPYKLYLAIWVIVFFGILAVGTLSVSKVVNNGYYRRLSRRMKGEYEKVQVQPWSYLIFQVALMAVVIQAMAFMFFIALNIPHSFQEPPKIEGLQAQQQIIEPGANTTIQAIAKDQDNDPLSYTWSASGGTIPDEDEPTITWIAPNSISSDPQEFKISVTVSDGRNIVERTTKILVRESPEITTGIQRLCFKARLLPVTTSANNRAANYNDQSTNSPSFSFIKANLQSSNSVDFKVGPVCDSIKEFVKAGETKQEQIFRIDLTEKEIENEAKLPKQAKRRCCSIALIPLFCDTTC